MALTLFDRPLFVQRQKYVAEVGCLEDAFDLLEKWPLDQRGLAFDVLLDACRAAASHQFPLDALRTNLERFFKKAGVLVDSETISPFVVSSYSSNIGSG